MKTRHKTNKHNYGGLSRLSLKMQALLLTWTLVVTATTACLLWTYYKSWLLAMLTSLGLFIWHIRVSVAELFIQIWVFILRKLGHKK